jgi:methionyl-tRNA formyltransferase
VTLPAPPRAIVCGYGEIGTIGLECLEEAGYAIVLLLTHEDDPGEAIWWRSPAEWARRRGLEVATPADVNTPAELARLACASPDFLFSFYYRAMLRPAVLSLPRHGALNLHGSLLPRYRGRAPVNWVLVNGEAVTGVTLHYMDEKPDHGDIVDQAEVPIAPLDTARGLFDKVAAAARVVLRRALPLLATGTAARVPQDHARATYFGRRTPADGRIDWSWPAARIFNLVRAVTHPYPGAFTTLQDRILKIWWATPVPGAPAGLHGPGDAAPGTVLGSGEDGVLVACGEGALLVRRIQTEGGPEIAGADGLAAALPAGTRLR